MLFCYLEQRESIPKVTVPHGIRAAMASSAVSHDETPLLASDEAVFAGEKTPSMKEAPADELEVVVGVPQLSEWKTGLFSCMSSDDDGFSGQDWEICKLGAISYG